MKKRKDPVAVYVLKAGPFVKIGHSKDIQKRISMLKTGSMYPISLCYYKWLDDKLQAMKMERFLHRKFKDSRYNGEWFTPNPYFDSCFQAFDGFIKNESIYIEGTVDEQIQRIKEENGVIHQRKEEIYKEFIDIIGWEDFPSLYADIVKHAITKYEPAQILNRAAHIRYYIEETSIDGTKNISPNTLKRILNGDLLRPQPYEVRRMFKRIWENIQKDKAAAISQRLNRLDDQTLQQIAVSFNSDMRGCYSQGDILDYVNQTLERHGN